MDATNNRWIFGLYASLPAPYGDIHANRHTHTCRPAESPCDPCLAHSSRLHRHRILPASSRLSSMLRRRTGCPADRHIQSRKHVLPAEAAAARNTSLGFLQYVVRPRINLLLQGRRCELSGASLCRYGMSLVRYRITAIRPSKVRGGESITFFRCQLCHDYSFG